MRTTIWLLIHLVLVLLGFLAGNSDSLASIIGQELAVGASASLIAAGITGFSVVLHTLFVDSRERAKQRLYDYGFRAAFEGRSVLIKEEYTNRLSAARDIDVIGFGLSAFREDYASRFLDLAQTKNIRILLLDPAYPSESTYADQRDHEEKNTPGDIAKDINQFIKQTAEVRQKFPKSFRVRLMTCLPSINLFRFDSEMLWGPYLVGEQSRNMPTFLVARGGYIFNRLDEHFNSIWSNNDLSREIE